MTVLSNSRRAAGAVIAVSAVLFAVTGCNVRGTVRVTVEDDGSGVVTVSVALDAATVEALGDPAISVVLDDLDAAGWTVSEPRQTGDLTVIDASKPFGSPDDLATVLAEIGGAEGLFRGVDLEVVDGFANTEYHLRGDIVASGSLTDFGDAELAAALDGEPVGYSAEELTLLVAETDGHAQLDLEVTLPGAERVDTSVELAGGEPVDVSFATSSTVRRSAPILWLVAAAIAALAAAALAVLVARGGRPAGPAPRATPRSDPLSGSGPPPQ